ncbi:sugar phosphate isomerase/epimerase [Candidatus Thorarchaeota archaeon]|nr:MAG: sugar phosphate isomerase/epimerase [Candidatus Thorarchaeota archaeon]
MFISCSILGGIRSSSSPEVLLSNMIRTLVRVKEAGYDTVELWYSNLPEWVGDTLVASLEDLSLKAYSIHLPKFLAVFDEKEFNEAVLSTFELVETLDLKVAVLHPPSPDDLSESQWREKLDLILKEAAPTDCIVALENVPYIKDVDMFILDQIGKHENSTLGITIDMEFMHINGSNIDWLTTAFRDRIVNIHFRDSDGNLLGSDGHRHYIIPGEGEIDLHRVVKVLHKSEYNGPLTVEVSHRQLRNIIDAKRYAEDCLNDLRSA